MSLSRRSFNSLEPLETRIAPALLINGANLLGGSSPATGETSVGDHAAELIHVTSGQAIVWFSDGMILGISVGPNTALEIHGNVYGDIVANLRADGRLSDSDNNPLNGEDGAILLPNNILGIKTLPISSEKGDLGNVITGGSISGVNIAGEIHGLFAGDGVFQRQSHALAAGEVVSSLGDLDFNPIASGVQSAFHFTKALAQTIDPAHQLTGLQAGASINNVKIAKAVEFQGFAGSGNPNDLVLGTKAQAGGSIRNVSIDTAFSRSTGTGTADTAPASYELRAGAGSSGLVGGAGGTIDHLIETTSSGKVLLFAGEGGIGSAGAGGAGGNISNTDAGSASSRYLVYAGNGGNGITGGAGGSLINNNFSNRSPIGGLLVSGDFNNDGAEDIFVINQGTGEMVLENNVNGDGTSFVPIVQYFDNQSNPVILFSSKGDTPISAFAARVDNNSSLDLVVAYKNSDSLAVYLNMGNGVFWDSSLNNGDGDYAGFSVGLSFSPAKMTPTNGTATNIVIAENGIEGGSVLHLLGKGTGTTSEITYNVGIGVNKLSLPVSDLVTVGDGSTIVATSDGKLLRATRTGAPEGAPFDVVDTQQKIVGGVADLDVNSTGDKVAALSATGHSFTVFDFNTTTPATPLSLASQVSGLANRQVSLHFVHDGDLSTADQLAVLSVTTTTSRVDLYTQSVDGLSFSLAKTVNEAQALKNFIPVYSQDSDAGFAAISSSLGQFTFSDGFLSGVDYILPFASKRVEAHAGDGGTGGDFTTLKGALKSGKGGAGGNINGFNAEANALELSAGQGGNATNNGGGAGGSISNPASFTTASGVVVKPALFADESLVVFTGSGGSATVAGVKTATGGVGGSLSSLTLDLRSGDLLLASGNGGNSRGGAAGAAGNIANISSVLHDGSLTALAGNGGAALAGTGLSGAGGRGGSITGLSHELTLDPEAEDGEKAYSVMLVAGRGGDSLSAAGGDGGSALDITLKLDEANITYDDSRETPPLVDAHKDSTVTTTITAGAAGRGAKGGNGGNIQGLKFSMVLDQINSRGEIMLGGAVLGLTAGAGGEGTNGAGGNGGSVLLSTALSGLSFLDKDAVGTGPTGGLPLLVTAGVGGDGSTKGGGGGNIDGITAENSPFINGEVITQTHLTGALLKAGTGGDGGLSDGGKGGSITNSLLGVQRQDYFTHNLQPVYIQLYAGQGGNGGTSGDLTAAKLAKGGAGGSIASGEFGLVSTNNPVGMFLEAGDGGSGVAAGGLGGALTNLKLNASQSTDALSAILHGGNGGAALAATGLGGKGGDINGITQAKDVNSTINLIQAGNGGNNLAGKGGNGGNVLNVRTVGFIGRPSDIFGSLGVYDTMVTPGTTTPVPQGVFSGRGGDGLSAALGGLNGSVTNVTARQIAAIAAATDSTGAFGAALKVQKVKADLIGYDADRGAGTAGDGVYNDALGGTTSPSQGHAQDGFILSQTALVNVVGQRTGYVFIEPGV